MKKYVHGLGVFVSKEFVRTKCPDGRCPEGWELYCFRAGRNPNACVIRLSAEVARKPRRKGDCGIIVMDLEKGTVRQCTPSQVEAGAPTVCRIVRGKREVVARICPPQRRKGEYEPGIVGGDIRPIRRKKK